MCEECDCVDETIGCEKECIAECLQWAEEIKSSYGLPDEYRRKRINQIAYSCTEVLKILAEREKEADQDV